MAYRLLVRLGDRTVRFALEPGRQLIGSSPECPVQIVHPTLSRRHAAIEIAPAGEVILTDMGSTNGTRLGGRAITAPALLRPGDSFSLGSVEAVLDAVGLADLEVGVTLTTPEQQEGARANPPEAVSTVGPAALETFALAQLPELLERLARGDERRELAAAVGAALLASLPSRRVEVVVDPGPREGVLFTGERGSGEGERVSARVDDRCELRVDFVGAALARTFEPLVRASAALLQAAGPRATTFSPSSPGVQPPPAPPDPPSVVPAMREVYAQAARVARGRVSVLIRGESGTGKELLARHIHAASERATAPLATLNCAALPRDLLESELFGVERGVATGVEARPGRFEAAHGGTLFLDEIGDMAPETQAKILRVLQENEVYRIGAHHARPANMRVISATNRDLDAMLADGRFRRDLYHRIADWVVDLPPLRSRRADIPNLAAHFLGRACAARGVRPAGISRAAVDALAAFDWPGNVRQLEKEMERAALFLEDGELLDTGRLQPVIAGAVAWSAGRETLREVLERAEREHLARVLRECDGAVPEAAKRLGIGVSTLYRRMKALGLS
jgi:pSer/pThr/pTyr-binding forkhead associated (FHA) protein